jgi:hypothetical protein
MNEVIFAGTTELSPYLFKLSFLYFFLSQNPSSTFSKSIFFLSCQGETLTDFTAEHGLKNPLPCCPCKPHSYDSLLHVSPLIQSQTQIELLPLPRERG